MRTLKADEIEIKVKQVIKTEKWSGFAALLYKTARVDMDILDKEYGAENWQSDYKVVKDNLYCGIGVYDKEKKEWVWKWDCGIESRKDPDGNEKKGEASDAFKRAGFKWGIGRELYTSPKILIPADVIVKDGKNYLKDPYATYSVQSVEYDENNNIGSLVIVDKNGGIVFVWKAKGFNPKK